MRVNNVDIELSKEAIMAVLMQEIWNPTKIPKYIGENEVRKANLLYRTRGVVLADRVLNREYVEEK